MASVVFFVFFLLSTPSSSIVCLFFVKSASRPRCGAWFWKPHSCKIMLKGAFQVPQSHGLRSFWGCLWHMEFAKSMGKMCISRLCALFGGFVCPYVFYRMHFEWKLHIFAMLSSWFCFKIDPALGSHIAQIRKATTACNICRIHVAMMSLDLSNTLDPLNPRPLAGIADCELHALFRRPEIAVPIKNRRAAVLPSPEGLH